MLLREVCSTRLFAINGPAAFFGAAAAADSEGFGMEIIIEGELLARMDSSPAEEQDVAPDTADFEIGIAAMVDVFGARAAKGAVNAPVAIQAKH